MRELDGKVALVTGGARNIGRAIALDLADGGAAVAIVVRSDVAGASAVVREVEARGGRALAIRADITDRGGGETRRGYDDRALHATRHTRQQRRYPARSAARAALARSVAPSDGGDARGAVAARPSCPYPRSNNAKGTIVNIGGLTAYTGAARRAHVVTAKAGLDGLTKALAVELAARDITVNLVSPGLIDTERDGPEPEHRKTRTTLLGRRGRPEDVSAAVRYLAGPNARYLTGQTIHVNGGVFLP